MTRLARSNNVRNVNALSARLPVAAGGEGGMWSMGPLWGLGLLSNLLHVEVL